MYVIYSLLASVSSFSNGHENVYHRFHVVCVLLCVDVIVHGGQRLLMPLSIILHFIF